MSYKLPRRERAVSVALCPRCGFRHWSQQSQLLVIQTSCETANITKHGFRKCLKITCGTCRAVILAVPNKNLQIFLSHCCQQFWKERQTIFVDDADFLSVCVPLHASHDGFVPVVDHLLIPRTCRKTFRLHMLVTHGSTVAVCTMTFVIAQRDVNVTHESVFCNLTSYITFSIQLQKTFVANVPVTSNFASVNNQTRGVFQSTRSSPRNVCSTK